MVSAATETAIPAEVKALKEKFLAVEKRIEQLKYQAKTTDELSGVERQLIDLVEQYHRLALQYHVEAIKCGGERRKLINGILEVLDEVFDLQEKLARDIGAAHGEILFRVVYSKLGIPCC